MSATNATRNAGGYYAPNCSVNWSADAWFSEHHAVDLTEEFKAWWVGYYGSPDEYEDEQREYWIRCGFALRGWLAARAQNCNIVGKKQPAMTIDGAKA